MYFFKNAFGNIGRYSMPRPKSYITLDLNFQHMISHNEQPYNFPHKYRFHCCSFLWKSESLPSDPVTNTTTENEDCNINWTQYHKKLNRDFIFIMKSVRNLKVYVDYDVVTNLCIKFQASDVSHIVKYPKLRQCSCEELNETISFLCSLDIKLTHLEKAPWLLWQTKDELIKKMKLLCELNLFENTIDGLGFLLFPPDLIEKYHLYFMSEKSEFPQHRNRIYYICDILKLPVDIFTIKLVSAWIILRMRKQKLDEIACILKEYKIQPKYIVNDLWIFYNNTEKIKSRLEILSHSSVPPKLWVCRAPSLKFDRFCVKQRDAIDLCDKDINLIYQDIAEELNIDIETLKNELGNLSRDSSIHKVSINFKLLKESGFTYDQVWKNILALTSTTDNIKKRLKALTDLGLKPKDIHISVFKKSEKKYELYYSTRKLEFDIKSKLKEHQPL